MTDRHPVGANSEAIHLRRERTLDLERRLSERTMAGVAVLLVIAGIVIATKEGWPAVLPGAAFLLRIIVGPLLITRVARPDVVVAALGLGLIATIVVAIAWTGGVTSPILLWLLIPAVAIPTRLGPSFPIARMLGIEVVFLVAAVLIADPDGLVDDYPFIVSLVATLVIQVGMIMALARSEGEHREAAVLDQLTGLLNRTSLDSRFEELRQQARLTGGSIALVMLDIDHFKALNDEFGHDRGDLVLREIAYALRKGSRSFELVYRLGGEEFLALLPGLTVTQAGLVADRLRVSIAETRHGGLNVTVSAGVSAAAGAEVDFDQLYREADQALYRAKRAGRNSVAVAGQEPRDHSQQSAEPSASRRRVVPRSAQSAGSLR
jgi:diguanylate cyclase (GGDEF)-like protein